MKKLFISVIALAMGMMATATETTYVQIKLSGENGGASSIYLSADDAYTSAFESGADVEKMMSQANNKSLLMYGFVGTTPCQNVVTNDLTGLEIGITTNQLDQNYTLSFIDFSGDEFVLFDKVANQLITVNASTPAYAFSVDPAQVGRVAINDRFIIGAPAASFCFNYNVLEINGHAGEALIVKKGAEEIANVPALPAAYSLDLNAQSGRLVVTLNGQDYQIDANPAVTPAN